MNTFFKILSLGLVAFLFQQCQSGGGGLTTPSGYSFEKTFEGNGEIANKGDFVYFELDIMDDKNNVLQSMRDLDQVPTVQIPEQISEGSDPNPLIEMLGMVGKGDSLLLYVPKDSMPNAGAQYDDVVNFIYKVNVVDIETEEEYKESLVKKQEEEMALAEKSRGREKEVASFVANTLADYKSGKLKDLVKLPSGLEYVIHVEGEGKPVPVGSQIQANYYGVVKSDGSMFDNSFKRGRAFSFTLGRGEVIKGWDEGMGLVNKGGTATLFIPYDMAYGEAGRPPSIPAKSDLVFYVEIQ